MSSQFKIITLMMKKQSIPIIMSTAFYTLIIFLIAACEPKSPKEVLGYAPLYGTPGEIKDIKSEPSKAIVNGGKIYQYLNYTFQIENSKGIHVLNSVDPSNPQRLSFIKVPGCSEMSIKNNVLYTDNFQDLVGINIANINSISVLSRLENVFPTTIQDYPPVAGVFFECVDKNEGTVIGWTEKLLIDPKCKR
jgi:hypothetical protein